MQHSVYSNFLNFLSQYVHFTDDEFRSILPYVKVVQLKKNQELISEGQIANVIAFTNKGYLRVYYNFDGEEITRDITLYNPNPFV